jgi:WD40 repeat protein
VSSVAFNADGSRIVSGSWDRTAKIWNAATGECERTLEGHFAWVRSVAFSPDGLRIASGSWDRTVKIWNAATGVAEKTLEEHIDAVTSVAFSPDGLRVASGSNDMSVKIWYPWMRREQRLALMSSTKKWDKDYNENRLAQKAAIKAARVPGPGEFDGNLFAEMIKVDDLRRYAGEFLGGKQKSRKRQRRSKKPVLKEKSNGSMRIFNAQSCKKRKQTNRRRNYVKWCKNR